MRGICLDKTTSEFPTYTLKKLEDDVHHHFGLKGGDPATLPKLGVIQIVRSSREGGEGRLPKTNNPYLT